jgi:hypothetical protein
MKSRYLSPPQKTIVTTTTTSVENFGVLGSASQIAAQMALFFQLVFDNDDEGGRAMQDYV